MQREFCLILCGFIFHRNLKNILFIFSKKLCGVGSDVKRFISFESIMLFITVIFPNGVNGLVCHLRISILIFTPQPLWAVGYCFHPWCPDGWAGGGKKFVRAVSQKP